MFNRKAKEIEWLKHSGTELIDLYLDWYDGFVNMSIKHSELESLKHIHVVNVFVYGTEQQEFRQHSIDLKRKDAIAEIEQKLKTDAKKEVEHVSFKEFVTSIHAPFIAGLEATGALKGTLQTPKMYINGVEVLKANHAPITGTIRDSQATKTAFEAIDMLIESLGNEAEQATSRTVLEAIKYRANHIRPIHVDDDAIFKSQQTRIDRLIENVDHLINNEIEIELEGVYNADFLGYNDFQILVRNGIRIRTGMEYSALDFLRFYDKGISVRSTVESTIAKSEEYAMKQHPAMSMDLR